jgi:hypothetical protein
MTTASNDINQVGAGVWRVRAERAQGGQAVTGEALVRADSGLHTALAGGRAWQALAQACLAAEDAAGAWAAARAGLDELGDRYSARSIGVIDDTALHVAMAEDQLEAGAAAEAAARLTEVLKQRLAMYARRHAEALAE